MTRTCLNCGSRTTCISKTQKGTPYEQWYKHEDGYICMKCRNKLYRENNPDKFKEYHKNWNHVYPVIIK